MITISKTLLITGLVLNTMILPGARAAGKRETVDLGGYKLSVERPADWSRTVRKEKDQTEVRFTKNPDAKFAYVMVIKLSNSYDDALKFYSKQPNAKSLANAPIKINGLTGTHLTFSRPVSPKDKETLIDDLYLFGTPDKNVLVVEGLFTEIEWTSAKGDVENLANSVKPAAP
jgi:hypothetical protein